MVSKSHLPNTNENRGCFASVFCCFHDKYTNIQRTKRKVIVTKNQLLTAMKEYGFDPPEENIEIIVKATNENFDDPEWAAMFLGQLAHESGGFIYTEEIGFADKKSSLSHKSYHGRGFIQLSHRENYRTASRDLGLGDKLLENPEIVSEDIEISAKVSVWYWKKMVMTYPGVKEKKEFGLTTRAINGQFECNGKNIEKSKRRYELYKLVAKHMGIEKLASEAGCYS